MKPNYLKYWRVVKNFMLVAHKITSQDLELLFFLYDETYFSRKSFRKYEEVMSWERGRINRMVEQGWLEKFRHTPKSRGDLFQLSYKAKRMVTYVYQMLDGTKLIPSSIQNPVFRKTGLRFTDKVHRNLIIEINKEYKEAIAQRRRRATE